MPLDNTKTITSVTYNGNNWPVGGGGAETVTLFYDRSGSDKLAILYMDENGNIVNRTGANAISPGTTLTMKKAPFVACKTNLNALVLSVSGIRAFTVDNKSMAHGASEANYLSSTPRIYFPVSSTITFPSSCFLPDTLITLADRTKKPIKDLTYDDELLVWDFDKGDFGTASICWLTCSGLMNDHYYKLTFSDGTILKTTGQNSNHKVYNVDERYFKGVDKTEIGDRIFSENGIVTVVNKEYIEEEIEYYNLITTHNINCFAEGILTSDRYGNLYPIDDNMVYVKEGREIRPYSEFEAAGIKRYWYDTLRLGEVTGTIEETKLYIDKLECQMLPLPEDNT